MITQAKFGKAIQQHDTVCLNLFERIFPKLMKVASPYLGFEPTTGREDENDEGTFPFVGFLSFLKSKSGDRQQCNPTIHIGNIFRNVPTSPYPQC